MSTATTPPLKHLAIIMDGNRRWAKAHGLPATEGHQHGYAKLKEVADWCIEQGIEYLTVYAFSTENWKRPAGEVRTLMSLLKFALTKELKEFQKRGLRVRISGRIERFSRALQAAIRGAERATAKNTKGVLTIALNYGGQSEILDAVQRAVKSKINLRQLTPQAFRQFLYAPEVPDPELIIRTSGEQRLSNFLTWQSAYSEFYFTKHHWPAFSKRDFQAALNEYRARQRRFGK